MGKGRFREGGNQQAERGNGSGNGKGVVKKKLETVLLLPVTHIGVSAPA